MGDDNTISDFTTLSYSSAIKVFKPSRLNMLYSFLRYRHAFVVIRQFLKKVIILRRSRYKEDCLNETTRKTKKCKLVRPPGLSSKFNHKKLKEDDEQLFSPQFYENY